MRKYTYQDYRMTSVAIRRLREEGLAKTHVERPFLCACAIGIGLSADSTHSV